MRGFVEKLGDIEVIASADADYIKSDLEEYYTDLKYMAQEMELVVLLRNQSESKYLEYFERVIKDRTIDYVLRDKTFALLQKVVTYTIKSAKDILLRNNELTYEIKISETSLRLYMQGLRKRIDSI